MLHMNSPPTLPQLLDRFRDRLPGLVRRYGGDLLRFESVHDLMQEIELHLLKNEQGFVYRGDAQFVGFLSTVAERVIINRRKFWHARRRDVRNVLRITNGHQSDEFRGVEPAAPFPTPSSIVGQREVYLRILRATGLLLEKDRQMIGWVSEGYTIAETADLLECNYDAAAKARYRAISRLKKAYKLVQKAAVDENEPDRPDLDEA